MKFCCWCGKSHKKECKSKSLERIATAFAKYINNNLLK